jgi:hypothetical protein
MRWSIATQRIEFGLIWEWRAATLTARRDLFGSQGVHYLSFMSTPLRPRLTSTPFDAEASHTCTPF